MNRYVKIKTKLFDYPNWFLVISQNQVLSQEDSKRINDTRVECIFYETLAKNLPLSIPELSSWGCLDSIDYAAKAHKYKADVLVRQIGSWMLFTKGMEITDTCYSKDFPLDNQTAKICICENSIQPDSFWVDYITRRYNQPIKLINMFSKRSDAFLKKALANVDVVTFSTTFSSMDWFEKAIQFKDNNAQVVGYSHNSDKWTDALAIYPDVTIVAKDQVYFK